MAVLPLYILYTVFMVSLLLYFVRYVHGYMKSFPIYLIPKMLLGETKKEYFGWKVKFICCIYVLLCIKRDEEWQGSYENPSQPTS